MALPAGVYAQLIIEGITLGRSLIEQGIRQIALMHQDGQITDEQLQQVKESAKISDEAWDAEVKAAKARLGQS